jgi:hypothetical protein
LCGWGEPEDDAAQEVEEFKELEELEELCR